MTRAGIHQITLPIPFPLQTVHVYLVEAGSGWIMVDSGFPSIEAREKLESEVTRLIGGMESLSAVIISHFHPDHSGLAGWIQSKRAVPVYIHAKDNERLSMLHQTRICLREGLPGLPGRESGGPLPALAEGGMPRSVDRAHGWHEVTTGLPAKPTHKPRALCPPPPDPDRIFGGDSDNEPAPRGRDATPGPAYHQAGRARPVRVRRSWALPTGSAAHHAEFIIELAAGGPLC